MQILALSGSLRAASLNSLLLKAFVQRAPDQFTINIFKGLGDLPLFNPDLEGFEPESVLTFRKALDDADAVLIASPEYAHGVTGVIKNALDWVVGSNQFSQKPTAVLRTSSRAHHAWDALCETLATMDAHICEGASLTLSLTGTLLNSEEMAEDPDFQDAIARVLTELDRATGRAS